VGGVPSLREESPRGAVDRAMARVLLAVHNADSGGAQLMALADARHLSRTFELTISVPDGSLRDQFAETGDLEARCRSLPIWGASPWDWARRVAGTMLDTARLTRLIRRRRIDVVLVNSTVLLAPVLAARLARVPAIVHAREFPMTRAGGIVFALHAALARTVITVSKAVEDEFPRTRLQRARFVRIPDGIEIPPPPPAGTNGFHRPVRLCVIGSVNGRRSKGQDVAVAALAHLAERGVDASLDLVGPISDPRFAEDLRRNAERLGVAGRVRIPGESRDIDDVIAAADIVLMCSRLEPLGLVPAEALARGRPVIAARTGGLPEVVTDGVTGLLVRPEDPVQLGEAVATLVRHPAVAREMTSKGREDVVARFDIERSLEHLQAEVERALAGGAR
jgi:glycosyltransferase involved in cell wall biosynthesis